MTCRTILEVGCDDCGATAVGGPGEPASTVRHRLHRAGWTTHRPHGALSDRDRCAVCTVRVERGDAA